MPAAVATGRVQRPSMAGRADAGLAELDRQGAALRMTRTGTAASLEAGY
jgi:hypothetical protein